MKRLSRDTLASLPADVSRPKYLSRQAQKRIVHLGMGAFHRAHQAYYTHLLMNRSADPEWGIVGVSLRRPDVAQQLNPQQGLYTLVEQSNQGNQYEVVGVIQEVLLAPKDPAGVVANMADEATKIVSLTVTEKGYCHDPATGELNLDHPDIRHDIEHLDTPKSAIGLIVSALRQRYQKALPPFTVLCCDNLPENGRIVSGLVKRFAEAIDIEFAAWMNNTVAFPCSMVDRIVPATQQDDIDNLAKHLGVQDLAMVKAEPFKQWVIENNFCAERPAWEQVGATFVHDVAAFEDMKLRLLNGSHSSIAYLGFLSGYEYVADVMANASLAKFIEELMELEITNAVTQPEKIDLKAYKQALLERFANQALKHRTYQIAMDGSQKLPQRLLRTLQHLLDHKLPFFRVAFVLATWMHYVKGVDSQGNQFEVQDPLVESFNHIEREHGDNSELKILAYLSIEHIFQPALIQHQPLVEEITQAYNTIAKHGVLQGVRAFNR